MCMFSVCAAHSCSFANLSSHTPNVFALNYNDIKNCLLLLKPNSRTVSKQCYPQMRMKIEKGEIDAIGVLLVCILKIEPNKLARMSEYGFSGEST